MSPELEQLVTGLQAQAGLDQYAAQRLAFCVCAYQAGYSKAQIARWLGVVRERVGQLLHKAEGYNQRYDLPQLEQRLSDRRTRPATERLVAVRYTKQQWDDDTFATGMLQRVS